MPQMTVTVDAQTMLRIERLRDASLWNPSTPQVARRLILLGLEVAESREARKSETKK